MNIALEQTEEYVNGIVTNRYGDAFIRGNNGIYLSFTISVIHLTFIQFCIFRLPSYFRRNAMSGPLDDWVKHVRQIFKALGSSFFCKQSCWEPRLAQFISYLSSSYAQYSRVKTLVPDLEELEFVRTSSINEVCRLQPSSELESSRWPFFGCSDWQENYLTIDWIVTANSGSIINIGLDHDIDKAAPSNNIQFT